MKILAIDTSSHACSVALLNNDQIKQIHSVTPKQQAQIILSLIKELLDSFKLTVNNLDAIAFGCGPGSFTGIRIAVSVAQGLGYAAKLPLIPVSSLAALAQSAYHAFGWQQVLTALDARIKEVYWGKYAINLQGIMQLQDNERVCLPENVDGPEDAGWYGAGSAWELFQQELVSSIKFTPLAINTTLLPTASGIISLAKVKYEQKEWLDATEVEPVYLRDKVTHNILSEPRHCP